MLIAKEKVIETIRNKLKENASHSVEFLNCETMEPVSNKINNLVQDVEELMQKNTINHETKGSLSMILNGLENIREIYTYHKNAATRATHDYDTYVYVLEAMNNQLDNEEIGLSKMVKKEKGERRISNVTPKRQSQSQRKSNSCTAITTTRAKSTVLYSNQLNPLQSRVKLLYSNHNHTSKVKLLYSNHNHTSKVKLLYSNHNHTSKVKLLYSNHNHTSKVKLLYSNHNHTSKVKLLYSNHNLRLQSQTPVQQSQPHEQSQTPVQQSQPQDEKEPDMVVNTKIDDKTKRKIRTLQVLISVIQFCAIIEK